MEKISNIKLNKIEDLVEKAYQKAESVRDKDIAIIIGLTGAGKTTLIHYLMGDEMEKILDKKTKRRKIQSKSRKINDSNDSNEDNQTASKTLFSEGYSQENVRFCYCDTPGFLDTRSLEERICTSVSIEMAVKLAKSIKGIIIVLEITTLQTVRGKLFKELSKILSILFKDPVEIFSSVQFLITNIDRSEYANDSKEDVKEFIIEMLEEHFKTVMGDISEIKEKYNVRNYDEIIDRIENKFQNGIQNDESKKLCEEEKEKAAQLLKEVATVKLMLSVPQNIIVADFLDKGQTRDNVVNNLLTSSEITSARFNFEKHYSAERRKFDELLGKISSQFSSLLTKKESLPSKKEMCLSTIKTYLNDIETSEKEIMSLNSRLEEATIDIQKNKEEINLAELAIQSNKDKIKELLGKQEMLQAIKSQKQETGEISSDTQSLIDNIMGCNKFEFAARLKKQYQESKDLIKKNINNYKENISTAKNAIATAKGEIKVNEEGIKNCTNLINAYDSRIDNIIDPKIKILKEELDILETEELIFLWSDGIKEKRGFFNISRVNKTFQYKGPIPYRHIDLSHFSGESLKEIKAPYLDPLEQDENQKWKAEIQYTSSRLKHSYASITAKAYKKDIPGNASRIKAITQEMQTFNEEKQRIEKRKVDGNPNNIVFGSDRKIVEDQLVWLKASKEQQKLIIENNKMQIKTSEEEISNFETQLALKDKEYKEHQASSMNTLESIVQSVEKQIEALGEANNLLQGQVKSKNDAIQKSKNSIDNNRTALAVSQDKKKDYRRKYLELKEEIDEITEEINKVEAELESRKSIYNVVANILRIIHGNTEDGTFNAFIKKYSAFLEEKRASNEVSSEKKSTVPQVKDKTILSNLLQRNPSDFQKQLQAVTLNHVEKDENKKSDNPSILEIQLQEQVKKFEQQQQELKAHIREEILKFNKQLNPDSSLDMDWDDEEGNEISLENQNIANNNKEWLLEIAQQLPKNLDNLNETLQVTSQENRNAYSLNFFAPPSNSSLFKLIQNAVKISQNSSIVSIIFYDLATAKQLQSELFKVGIVDPNMPDEARKINMPDKVKYEIILSEVEYNALMGENAYEELVSTQHHKISPSI